MCVCVCMCVCLGVCVHTIQYWFALQLSFFWKEKFWRALPHHKKRDKMLVWQFDQFFGFLQAKIQEKFDLIKYKGELHQGRVSVFLNYSMRFEQSRIMPKMLFRFFLPLSLSLKVKFLTPSKISVKFETLVNALMGLRDIFSRSLRNKKAVLETS